MAVEIEIKIDPTGAVGAAKQVGDALGKAEDAGKKAGDAIDASLMKSISRGEQAKDAIEQLRKELAIIDAGGTSGNRANALERELDMYTKIKGPVVEYTASLRALDSLMEQQKITTSEYADQVTRLNRTFQSSRPGDTASAAQRPSAPQDSINPQAMLGQIAAATAASVAIVKLGDDYVEVSNRVQRFATELHSADSIVRDQLALAGQLHAGLGETSQLYERLRASTTDVNMTYQQSIDLTKTLGEASVLSGHSVGDASMLITKLSYAMESGTLTGREMKSMMREFPAVGDLWEQSLGKTRGELVAMANHGTLSIKQLMDALVDGGKTIDEQFSKRTVTAAEEFQHFKDEVVVDIGKIVQESGALKVVGEGFHSMVASITPVTSALDGVISKLDKIASYGGSGGSGGGGPSVGGAVSFLASHGPMWAYNRALEGPEDTGGRSVSQVFGFDQGGQTNKQIAEQVEQVEVLKKSVRETGDEWVKVGEHLINEVGVSVVRTKDIWGDGATELTFKFGGAIDAVMSLADRRFTDLNKMITGSFHEMSQLLDFGMRQLGVDDPWNKKDHKAPAHHVSESEKIFEEATQGSKNWQKEMTTLNQLYADGRVSVLQYAEELGRINARSPDHNFETQLKRDITAYDDAAKAARLYRDAAKFGLDSGQYSSSAQGQRDLATDVRAAQSADAYGDKAMDAREKQRVGITDSFATSGDKYTEELLKIQTAERDGVISTDELTKFTTKLQERYAIGLTPLEEWAKAQANVNDLLAQHAITAEHAARATDELSAKYNTTFEQGITNGVKGVTDSIRNMAATTSSVINDMYTGLSDNITQQIATGTASWDQYLTKLKTDAVKLSLQGLAGAFIGPAAGASSAGVVTGTSAVTTMLEGAPGIGAAIGAAANAAMSLGSSAGPASGGGVAGLFGSLASPGGGDAAASGTADAAGAAPLIFHPSGPAAPPPIHIFMVNDMEEAVSHAMQSPRGVQAHIAVVAKNRKTLRAHLAKP